MQLFARMEMNKDQANNWVAGIRSMNDNESEVSTKERIERIPRENNDWWRPGKPRRFISMIVRPKYNFDVNILVDMDDDHNSTIYLYRSK